MFQAVLRITLLVCCVFALGSVTKRACAQQHTAPGTGPWRSAPMLPIEPAPAESVDLTLMSGLFPQDSVRPSRRNYTWEGAGIGAGILGTLGAILLGGFCAYSDVHESCVGSYAGGAVVGVVIGGVIGGMIGGNIRKGPAPVPANNRMDQPSAFALKEPE